MRIVWHFEAAGEARTFTVAYRFRGLAVAYDDVVDVNLRVWGANWSSPLGELAASMTLPRPAPLTPSYRVWGHPPSVNGVVTRTRPAALLRAVNIPSNQWVEMRVVFPRRLLTSTAGAKVVAGQRPGADRREGGRRRGRLPARPRPARGREAPRRPDGPLPPPDRHRPGGPVMLLVWFVYGRERKTGYDREYEQAPPTTSSPR